MIAVVIFEKVYTDACKVICIIKFVTEAAGISRASLDAAAGIHAEFQSLGMNIVRNGFHSVREFFLIRNKHAVFVTLFFAPAIVNYKILISCGKISAVDHCVSHFFYKLLVYILCECVP